MSTPRPARRAARLLAALALALVAAGCAPKVDLTPDGDDDGLRSVDLVLRVTRAGDVVVHGTVEFASDAGGRLGIPGLATESILAPRIEGLRVDDVPAAIAGTVGVDGSAVAIDRRRATVDFTLVDAVAVHPDVAYLDLAVLPTDGSRFGSEIDLRVQLRVNAGTLRRDAITLGTARDAAVRVDGARATITGSALPWIGPTLLAEIPREAVPRAPVEAFDGRIAFDARVEAQRFAASTTDLTLDSIDAQLDASAWIVTAVAIGLPTIAWLAVLRHAVGVWRRRRRLVADVPEHLAEPPTADGPAVVGTLVHDGAVPDSAFAGEVLALAHRGAIDIAEVGDLVRVRVPLELVGSTPAETVVLEALRRHTDARGEVALPRGGGTLTRRDRRRLRRITRKALRAGGLVTRVLPMARVSPAITLTGIGIGMYAFTEPRLYLAIVLGAQVLGWGVAFVGGDGLTEAGVRRKALWQAFARYTADHGDLRDVGPEGVKVWGPYLVHGTVLDLAPTATRPFS